MKEIDLNKNFRKKILIGSWIDHEELRPVRWKSFTIDDFVSKTGKTFEMKDTNWWKASSFSIPSTATGKYLEGGMFVDKKVA